MKKRIYILSAILFLLGSLLILVGLDVINIITSAHRLRYVLGGACVDLLAVSGSILVSIKNIKAKLLGVFNYFRSGILAERRPANTETLLLALFLGLIGSAAFILVLWMTPFGAGINPDSVTYIGSAKNLFAGNGYSFNGSPETHFPPLYALFLAAMQFSTHNFVQAARILNALLFGINAALIALVVYLTTGRKFFTASVAVLFFAASAKLLEMHAWAFSEPLFIAFSLVCILFLFKYIHEQKLVLLVAASLSLGLALITRYIGMAFLPAILISVFLSGSKRNFRRRSRDSLIALVVTCAPLAIFFIRNQIAAGSATDRNFYYHPLAVLHYFKDLWEIAINLIAPLSLPGIISISVMGLIAVLLVAQIIILIRRHSGKTDWHSIDLSMPVVCFLFSACYVVFLYVSISFMDASTPVDGRILSPVLCILIIGVFSTTWVLAKAINAPLAWSGFMLCVIFSLALKSPEAIRTAADIQKFGLQYSSRQWRDSETIAYVKSLPDTSQLFTNGPDVLSFLTDKRSASIPNKISSVTRVPNSLYAQQVSDMCESVENSGAFVVYFNEINWRWYLPTQAELASACKLPILKRLSDGIVYGKQLK